MVFNIALAVHIVACVLLVIVVLMQSSKGGALSAAFGGGGGQIFGGRETATFLGKATTYLAVLFFLTSLSLAFLSAGRSGSGASSALRRAASERQFGTIPAEDQKDVQDVLGNVPQPGQEGQEGAVPGKPPEGGSQPAGSPEKPNPGGN